MMLNRWGRVLTFYSRKERGLVAQRGLEREQASCWRGHAIMSEFHPGKLHGPRGYWWRRCMECRFQLLIVLLSLTIGLGTKTRWQTDLHANCWTDLFPDLGPAIGENVKKDPVEAENAVCEELNHVQCCGRFGLGAKMCIFWKVIYYGEYYRVSTGRAQTSHTVESDVGPGLSRSWKVPEQTCRRKAGRLILCTDRTGREVFSSILYQCRPPKEML